MNKKKIALIGAIGLSLAALAACGGKTLGEHVPTTGELYMPDYTNEIAGVVARFDNGKVMLITDKNEPLVLGGDMNFDGLETGNHLTIYCDGVMESYPGQVIVKEMMLNSTGDPADVPSSVLEDLKELGWILQESESKEAATFAMISMEEAKARFAEAGDYIILDVRTAEEYAEGHIPGAINVANESIGSTDPAELPDKDKLIYVYCRSGRRSKMAAEKLVTLGYTNIVECGGINDWTGDIEK